MASWARPTAVFFEQGLRFDGPVHLEDTKLFQNRRDYFSGEVLRPATPCPQLNEPAAGEFSATLFYKQLQRFFPWVGQTFVIHSSRPVNRLIGRLFGLDGGERQSRQ